MAGYTREQLDNIRRIKQTPEYKAASPRERKAAFEAVIVESDIRDLNYGDRDSKGILQQRNNGAWGAAKESVEKDVGQFFAKARQLNTKGGSAGQLAQRVQVSAFPGRYDEHSAEAAKLVGGTAKPSKAYGLSKGTPPTLTKGGETTDTKGAVTAALLGRKPGQSLTKAILENVQSGAYTTTTAPKVTPGTAPKYAVGQPSSKAAGKGGSQVLELIYNDGGKGFGIKDGKDVDGASVFSAVWAGHANHVHVAAGPKTVVQLGKLAQSMGLHVGENPHFGGVDAGAHVKGSYHVKGEAIDVSGDAKKMKAYAQAVEKYSRGRS